MPYFFFSGNISRCSEIGLVDHTYSCGDLRKLCTSATYMPTKLWKTMIENSGLSDLGVHDFSSIFIAL